MSTIEATKWFSAGAEIETDLILRKYSQSFIKEVRALIPGELFSAYTKLPHADPHDHGQIIGGGLDKADGASLAFFYKWTLINPETLDLKGSLLPFSGMGHEYIRPSEGETRVNLDVHDSVHHWRLSTSGKVEIDRACILSSNTLTEIPKSPEVLPAVFWGFLPNAKIGAKDSSPHGTWTGDVHEWTRTTGCKAHIVVTKHKAFKQVLSKRGQEHSASKMQSALDTEVNKIHIFEGVVFRVIERKTEKGDEKVKDSDDAGQGREKLIKIGCFCAYSERGQAILPVEQQVCWDIL